MTDEKGIDEKILAVPVDSLNPFYSNVKTHKDLPPLLVDQIAHFFKHYKDLEPGKIAHVGEWATLEVARERIMASIARAAAAGAHA
jgi:inorganic pyrophosphatase